MKDKYKAQKKYDKSNMKKITVSYKNDFVDEYKIARDNLGYSNSQLIRKLMQNVIDEYNKKK